MADTSCETIHHFLCPIHVCQIGVMIDFETITLSQDGTDDFKTIAVFLFSKFNRQPVFFFAIENYAMSALSLAKKQID